MHSCEDLDERGFAGAVLADEAVHLAADELDVAVPEGVDGPEALLRVLESEHRVGLRVCHDRAREGAPRTRRPFDESRT
jgi:hypothetical protein